METSAAVAAAMAAEGNTVSEMVRGQACDVGRPTLPPALHHNLKRRVIERFKKNLFSQQSNPCNLKSEIKKLSQGSPEPIEPSFFTADYHLLHHSSSEHSLSPNNSTGLPTSFALEEGITYEQMQTVIEEVLEESWYYNFTSNRITQPKDENAAF